jgi:hypothetical protein
VTARGPDHKGCLVAKQDDIARAETRAFLVSLRDALGQPPLLAKQQVAVDRVLDLLAEPNIAKRVAARDRLDGMLAELDGRADL